MEPLTGQEFQVGVITVRAIVPSKVALDTESMLRAIENTLDGAAKDIKIDFDVTTQTWRTRPDFTIDKSEGRRLVSTDNEIYGYLDRGTSVRYATMSGDFAPKTRSGFIGSNAGRGGVLNVSRLHPRPGIEARKFAEAIQKKWDGQMQTIFQRAIDAEARRQMK
jgi:hypothetical protein